MIDQTEYNLHLPLGSVAIGGASPFLQNMADLPGLIQGGMPIEQNAAVGGGPSPFYIPGMFGSGEAPPAVDREAPEETIWSSGVKQENQTNH